MERIIAGVDGSPAAFDALSWASDVADRAGFGLVAARVFVPTQAELPPDEYAALQADQLRELEAWCTKLASTTRPEPVLLDGDPAGALLTAADRDRDLLVVGARGEGGFRHLELGSVAHHLTHHTTVPLAIVPANGAARVEHFVVGLDGSKGSAAAAKLTSELGHALAVDVTAVYAFDPLIEWVEENDPRSWHRYAARELEQWAAPIEAAGVHVDLDIDRDVHPVAAIARALEARPGSAAIVGTRGIGGFAGLRLGRVPLQLVHTTAAPVIMVPPHD